MGLFKTNYVKKEAKEHMLAEQALANADLTAWHKHESKAHKYGAKAKGNGLSVPTYISRETVTPVEVPVEVAVPVEAEKEPIFVYEESCDLCTVPSCDPIWDYPLGLTVAAPLAMVPTMPLDMPMHTYTAIW